MNRIVFVVLLAALSCKKEDSVVTVVNVGMNNRIGIGKQLRIINEFFPKVVALDFYLVPDSLDNDSILVNELKRTRNSIQVVGLHDPLGQTSLWDSLELSNSKFQISQHGFANLTTNDSVVLEELPMQQFYREKEIYSFSYVIAKAYSGVKQKYLNNGDKEFQMDLHLEDKHYKFISKEDLFSRRFKPEDLNNKIVIMGYIGDKEDYFYLDEGKTKRINGVEVHAAIINEIVER